MTDGFSRWGAAAAAVLLNAKTIATSLLSGGA